jgi:cob(I)alamin adenosyltransferase
MLQLYTGDGKGKTTAAVGLAVRAAGAGKKVAFIQFDKGFEKEDFYHERRVLESIPGIELMPTGVQRMTPGGDFRFGVNDDDRREAARGVELTLEALASGRYDLVVADEILSAASYGLIEEEALLRVVEAALSRRETETVFTGRGAPEGVVEKADLVTEMRKVKHYFDSGVKARPGIEY